jgi:hypothetical protein
LRLAAEVTLEEARTKNTPVIAFADERLAWIGGRDGMALAA